MNEFIDFIKSNYQVLIMVFLGIIELVLLIFRRSKNVLIDDSATSELLDLVINAEKQFGSGNGDKKLQYVLSSYFEKHPTLKPYESIIIGIIEAILSSPQRKE